MPNWLLIFDLDGTLIDSRRDLCTAVNFVRRRYGRPPLPLETVAGYVGEGIRSLMQRSLDVTGADLDEAVALQKRFYREHMLDETRLYPGVEDGLRRLRAAGCALAVATNKVVDLSESLLAGLGVRPLFARVAGDGSTAALKPDPAMILETMAELRMPADRTWVIGDGVTDLEAARRAGVHGAWAEWGIGQRGSEIPERRFAAFPDVVEFFLNSLS